MLTARFRSRCCSAAPRDWYCVAASLIGSFLVNSTLDAKMVIYIRLGEGGQTVALYLRILL